MASWYLTRGRLFPSGFGICKFNYMHWPKRKKEGEVEREIIEIVQVTLPSIHLKSECPRENMRLEIRLSWPHSRSKPEATLNHIWSHLKKPQRVPTRRGEDPCVGFTVRINHGSGATLHVLLTHCL